MLVFKKIVILFLFSVILYSNDSDIKKLFSKKLRFNRENIPVLKIGLSQTYDKIKIKSQKNLRINNLKINKGDDLTVEYKIIKKAEYLLWIILDKYSYYETPNIENYKKLVKKLGKLQDKKIKTINIGNLSVINGNEIDIRKRLIVLGPFLNESVALKFKNKLYVDLRLKTEFYARISKYPQAYIYLKKGGKIISKNLNILKLNAEDFTLKKIPWGFLNKKKTDFNLSGKLIFTVDLKNRLTVINQVDLETMLKGIVPAEIFASAPMEALKAQTIAARSDILAKIGTRHFISPYDICSTQHCQVYKGKSIQNRRTDRAVKETKGIILKDNEGIIDAYYSANSGGYTENNENVWLSRSRISLRGRDDFIDWEKSGIFMVGITEKNLKKFIDSPPETYSENASFLRKGVFRWKVSYGIEKLNHFIGKYLKKYKIKKKCKLKDLKPGGRGVSGRLMALKVLCKNKKNNFTVYGELQIRRFLGNLKSSMFYMNKFRDKNKELSKIEFVGGGWGHGVGMCQTGAIGMAEYGKSFKEILYHYYTGSKLKKIY